MLYRRSICIAVRLMFTECFSWICQVSKLLEGKEFCVINGPSHFPKQRLEEKVVEQGGVLVQNPGRAVVLSLHLSFFAIAKLCYALLCYLLYHYIPVLHVKHNFVQHGERYTGSKPKNKYIFSLFLLTETLPKSVLWFFFFQEISKDAVSYETFKSTYDRVYVVWGVSALPGLLWRD